MAHVWRGIITEYRDRMPVTDKTPIITLREGGTPLIHSERLSELTGCEVHLKWDGVNPTASFKDRGMTMAMSKAIEDGAKAVICASTGNTSAAAAAYAAKAGITCAVVVPDGKIATGKLAQAMVLGATVLQIDGNFDRALELCQELSDTHPITLVNSVNPYRIDGQRSGAWEVCDQLGGAPDILAIPVGNAGNITAYWRGFTEYKADDIISDAPRMWGFQAKGAAPIVDGHPNAHPETIATAIRIGNPASWKFAEAARDESEGVIEAVTDRQIHNAWRDLTSEGVFCEHASAASVAGLLDRHARGLLDSGQRVVCVLTGNGLKDPEWATMSAPRPTKIEATTDAAVAVLGL